MNIGIPQKEIIVEPIESPVPRAEPAPADRPREIEVPREAPVLVPA
jgi:hypothetical protein